MSGDAPQNRSFTDCRPGLIAFGIIEILIGGFCALMVPLIGFAMVAAAKVGETDRFNARVMLPSLLVYVFIAAWFIWLGIGSALCRRWARTILLVTSWMTLVLGIVGMAY